MMQGLVKILLIESAMFRYVDLDISINTLLLGNSGVGKTSIMRAILFFYTMDSDSAILGLTDSETKKTFIDWYFDINGASYIAYQYTSENGEFLFIVSKLSSDS